MGSQIQDPSQRHINIGGNNNPSEGDCKWKIKWLNSKDGDPRRADKRRWKSFWFNPQVLLGSFPLKEFDLYSPLLAKNTAPTTAWTSDYRDSLLKNVENFVHSARHGGPSLSHLRGVYANIHHCSRFMLIDSLVLKEKNDWS